MMRKLTLFTALLAVILILGGCGKKGYKAYKGQLLGVMDRPDWQPVNPYGMVYIPSGTLHVGTSDEDMNKSFWQRTKSISIQGFYMDETEITNNEYRQFVYWVRDSIAHVLLGHFKEDSEVERIDWSQEIDWSKDGEDYEVLQDMHYSPENTLWGRKEIDKSQLVYEYEWMDWQAAAKKGNGNREKERSEFINRESVNIYPDTLVWVHDFAYSYNEPMTRQYFSHPAFDDYPVVGVNWRQAMAFSTWRTRFWNSWRTSQGESITDPFRLPTESEWEYAARGGRDQAPYPWGGPYLRNSKGCILANFKPGRGNYPEDGGFYTVRADAYWPNDYGLYNMAGNVSEWTSSAFDENASSFTHDMNPDYRYDTKEGDPMALQRKVVRGGSWKDIGYMLQTGTRDWEYEDTAKSYVGFRCVMTFLGRSMSDFE
jgi:gliding motility-associated lipoprotein GldK